MTLVMPDEPVRENVPAGTNLAVCFRIVDLGTQATTFGSKRQVLLSFEFPDELTSKGQPFTISRTYNYSSDKKSSLRNDVESWLGRVLTFADFGKLDLGEMLGKTCLLGIKHDEREGSIYATITSIMKPPKGTAERLPVVNAATVLSLDDRPFRQAEFEALPQWVRDKIVKSPEYAEAIGKPLSSKNNPPPGSAAERVRAHLAGLPAGATAALLDDEIPF